MANYLGIEIGPDAVRGALIKTQLRKVQVARYLEVPIVHHVAIDPALAEIAPAPAEGAPPPPPPEPADPVRDAIRELIRQCGTPRPSIIAAMPGEDASIRRIELPAAAAKKIDELLPFEMEALVPFDAEQTMLDHQPIETAEGKLRVLVVAVPKDRIRAQLEQLDARGADPQELAVGAAALDGLPQVVPALATEGPHLVVHLGDKRVDLAILRRAHCELARTISAGARDIHEASYATGAATAPAGVRFAGSAAERLARELKQTIASWRMQGGAVPAAIWASGLAGIDPRMIAWLSEVLGQTVQLLELPDAVPASQLDPATRARCGFALALAARPLIRGKRVDLRKGEFVARRTTGWVRQHAPLLSACAGAIVVAFLFSTYARWSVLDARRTLLEDQLARVSRERLGEETRSPSRARTLLESGGTRTDPLPRFSAFDALAALSNAIHTAGEITHDVQRLHVDLGDDRSGGHFELSGIVGSIEDRDRIAQSLGEVECFREIELGPLTQAPNGRRSYRIEADILCPGDTPPESARRGGRSRSGGARSGGARSATGGGGEE